LSKVIVRQRAAKSGTWNIHAVESAARPMMRRSGSPLPCSS